MLEMRNFEGNFHVSIENPYTNFFLLLFFTKNPKAL